MNWKKTTTVPIPHLKHFYPNLTQGSFWVWAQLHCNIVSHWPNSYPGSVFWVFFKILAINTHNCKGEICSVLCEFKTLVSILLCMCSANERRRYIVTSSLIGWLHAHVLPCSLLSCIMGDLPIWRVHVKHTALEVVFRINFFVILVYCGIKISQ